MTDYAVQRLNMVESQVRPSDVTDRRVMNAMSAVPREQFVPEAYRAVAYSDTDLTVHGTDEGAGTETLVAPRVLARQIQHLELNDNAVVLVVGADTGYSTAILARIAQTVVAVGENEAWVTFASTQLSALSVDNAAVVKGPITHGYPDEGPYDAILINGMVDDVPHGILDQLKDGGCLVAVVAKTRFGSAVQWRRTGETYVQRWLFDAVAPRLPGFERAKAFEF